MTKTHARILELFRTLEPDEQRSVVETLSEAARTQSFYARMTPQQRALLDEGIIQAQTGDVTPAADVFEQVAEHSGAQK